LVNSINGTSIQTIIQKLSFVVRFSQKINILIIVTKTGLNVLYKGKNIAVSILSKLLTLEIVDKK
jgi:hypothetical protein